MPFRTSCKTRFWNTFYFFSALFKKRNNSPWKWHGSYDYSPTTAISGSPVRFSSGGTLSSSLVFSTGLAKGSTVIGTSTSHGWAVGDKILLDQLLSSSDSPPVDDGSRTYTDYARNSDRLPGQIVKVIRVISSTSVEIEIPTYWNYNSSRSPQATKINNWMDNAGIEDLTINKDRKSVV